MPGVKSVYEVAVDDKEFVAFYERFKNYQGDLEKAKDSFADMDKIVGAIGAGFKTMGVLLAAQSQHEADAAKELRKQQEEQKRLLEIERARRAENERMWKASVEIAKNVGSITLNLAKWAGFGVLAGLMGGFGLDKLVSGPANDLRTAQGMNVKGSQLMGLRNEFGRYANVDQVLENIAQAQFDPQAQPAWNLMGIADVKNKSVEQLFLEVMRKAGPAFAKIGENPLIAKARRLDQFMDMDSLRRLANPENAGAINVASKEYAARYKQWELMDKTNQQWQQFLVDLRFAGQTIEMSLVRGLLPLNRPLSELAQEFAGMVQEFTGSAGFKQLMGDFGQALQNLVNEIKSGQFEAKMKEFFDDFGQLTNWVHARLVQLGIIQPSADEGRAMSSDASLAAAGDKGFGQPGLGQPGGLAGWWTNLTNFATGKGDALAHQRRVLADLSKFDANAQAGIMGNITGENANFDPFAKGDHGTAFGLFQWHGPRQAAYAKMFGHTMQSVKDWQQAVDEQIKFAIAEAHGDVEGGQFATPELFHGAGYGSVVKGLVTKFERSKNQGRDIALRTQYAKEIVIVIQSPPGSDVAHSARMAAGGAGSGG